MHWSEEKILEKQDDVLTFIIIAYDHTEPFLLKKKLPGLISDATLILWLILEEIFVIHLEVDALFNK